LPVRLSDDFDREYRMNSDDLDNLVGPIADDCGRSLEDYEKNLRAGISTVSDRIEFLCAQPVRASAAGAKTPGRGTDQLA